MPAMVESMMYTGHAPWHGLGVSVENELKSSEAIRVAGLDWRVEAVPLLAAVRGQPEVAGYQAVVRSTDQKPLGIVGRRYVPVQNDAAFSFFDSVVGQGQAIYHTAGSLDGGKRVWMMARLPGEVRVRRWDVTEKYLLLVNSHDGSTALRMLFTPVRVVCMNTLSLALARGARDGIAIRHTASAMARVAEAQRALGFAQVVYDNFSNQVHRLADSPYTERQMHQLVQALFPVDEAAPSRRLLQARDETLSLFDNGAGHELIRGTAWAAWNAVAEYADHVRNPRSHSGSTTGEARLRSVWFGGAAALKRQAHDIILQQIAA